MAYVVTLYLPGRPDPAPLQAALGALARANASWYLDEWTAGRTPPPTARDGGVRYVPRGSAPGRTYSGAPRVFQLGVAECGGIAAIAAGHPQALERARGRSEHDAAALYQVVLEPADDPRGQTADYWHAVVQTPRGRIDPTEGMVS